MANNKSKEEILKKIKQLLALSESDNIHEAQSAMLKAQKLMVKYHISENEALNNVSEEDLKKIMNIAVISNKARLMWYEKSLARIIGKNFNIVNYLSGNRKIGMNINFMGLEEDVEIAQEIYHFALNNMKSLCNKAIENVDIVDTKNEKKYKSAFKNDFYKGFVFGLDEAFKKQVTEEGWGLVLVKDELVVQEEIKLNLKTVKSTGIPPKFSNNRNMYNEGFINGKNFGESFNNGNSLKDNESSFNDN